jgi:hypothetical protein
MACGLVETVPEIAPVERYLGELAGIQHAAGLGGFGLEHGRHVLYLDRFGGGADFQADVNARRLVHFQAEGAEDTLFEAVGLGGDSVSADRKKREVIDSRVGALCGVGNIRCRVRGGDPHVGNGGPGRVGDRSSDRAGCGLRRRGRNQRQQ